MGDGGVVSAPLQHVMERFPASEAFCSGGGGLLASKVFKSTKRDENGEQHERKGQSGADKARKFDERTRRGELEKGEFTPERRRKGELQNGELEKGEFVPDRWRRGEVEAGEFIPERPRREVEKGEFVPDKSKKGGDLERLDFGSGRSWKDELEKGEFVPERSRKDGRERGRERERERDRSPDDSYTRKEGGSSERDHRKRLFKSDSGAHERDSKKYSRAAEEEPRQYKHELDNGKSHDKDYSAENWPKRNCTDSDGSGRKYHWEGADRSGSKVRKESEERKWSERSHREASSSSSRVLSASRYSSSRHHEPFLPSRGGHDRPHDRSPGYRERSPRERTRHHDHRDRSPSHLERSPLERVRHQENRERTPGRAERSPHDRGRTIDPREPYKRSVGRERQQSSSHEERLARRECSGQDSFKDSSVKQLNSNGSYRDRSVNDKSSKKKSIDHSIKELNESSLPPPPHPPTLSSLPPPPPLPPIPLPPKIEVNGVLEEPVSMEEDMDICDTPPHDTVSADSIEGNWFYIDHFGIEQGPSRLVDLKRLVEEGILHSDHLIKHSDTDRWVTVENAASPLVTVDIPSIFSDDVTQMVRPPEAPGNLLADFGDISQESSTPKMQEFLLENGSTTPEFIEELCIDERVGALLNGYTIISGKELETIGEALNTVFEHPDWEKWGQSEDFTRSRPRSYEVIVHPRDEGVGRTFEGLPKEASKIRLTAPCEEYSSHIVGFNDWFAGRWSCKGGDWKKNDEGAQDRYYKRKLVLNEGYPLSQMPNCGHEDPRRFRKDEPHCPSHIKKLDLPIWAFSSMEDKGEGSNDVNKGMLGTRTGQLKPLIPGGVKGTLLPVVRINACVIKDHGSSEPRMKVKGSERHNPRSSRPYSLTSDTGSFFEGSYGSKKLNDRDLQSLHKCRTILNIPRDHVCTIDELSVDLGDWYYLDGAGHEHGPSSYSELQELVSKGFITEHISVFRKIDNVWLPITTNAVVSETVKAPDIIVPSASSSCLLTVAAPTQSQLVHTDTSNAFNSFHSMHPQFIGYMRGKLHELVMKSYKNREFAAGINEVLDPWLSARQPKKELDKHFPFNSSITKSSSVLVNDMSVDKFWKSADSGDSTHSAKRARLLFDSTDEDSETEEGLLDGFITERSFDDLCGEATFVEDDVTTSLLETDNWGLLDGGTLARIFHFLRTDMKSLVSCATACKRWNKVAKFYKNLCEHIDLSFAGPNCTDSMFLSILVGYDRKKVTSIVLTGCSNVSACVIEEALQSFPCLYSLDIRGCGQFKDLESKYQNIRWINSLSSRSTKNLEESHSKKTKRRKQINDQNSTSKVIGGLNSYLDDSGDGVGFGSHEVNLVDRKDTSNHPFRKGFYKRTKLLDARKSSSIPSRNAHMRQWPPKKPQNSYKKMEEFIALSLKDIMKGNRFEFFIPKVAKIEDKMRRGHYVRNGGLTSLKDDISRMCRDALKTKNRDNGGDLKQIIMSFIQLAGNLKENQKLAREEMIATLKDGSDAGFFSSASKYTKKQNRVMTEKKGLNKTQCTPYGNGGTDYGSNRLDHEIRRRLSKLKKNHRDSESETSDDHGDYLSEEDVKVEAESTASDTESDLDLHLGGGIADAKNVGYSMTDDALDSMTDDREWGARMTKASYVPPVTRKYEVIDRYHIIADEEEVKRKMQVALPDDYAEKLLAQKSGVEESDIGLPEVKEYKPRKILGVEVLEQEVYGIDPYTHNLLLDSMPDEPDWPLVEKDKFIEGELLCLLNKQVRHFTGAGSAPVTYPLRPVVEEIQKNAEKDGDAHILKMCLAILKAMQTRRDDSYVAYRKGLGVICNKEEGFGIDDFVVEFLGEVYPAWKWHEKQDGIRSLQKNNQDPAPEFYNINLERPKGDRDGFDLVVVDAMHKANYASRICHSCSPNCQAKVTAVDGQYQIGLYTLRPISNGEEITFDYNSVTESKEEYEASVCLCGSQICRGSYLNLTGESAFTLLKVLTDCHGVLDRHKLMLEACESNSVNQEEYDDLAKAGLNSCLLTGLPDWLVSYSAHLVRFINFERTKLPGEILKYNLEEKRKFFSDIVVEYEKTEAENQAEGVYSQRLQNVAITLDKVRYVMRCVFEDPKNAPPPLQKLNPEALVSALWEGEGSLVEELLQSMSPHVESDLLNNLKSQIRAHTPSCSDDPQKELRKSLLWLRDELRDLPCTCKCRHDAAADLIHIYAHTKCFFKVTEYKSVKSPPVYITPLDLGPKYADKMGGGFQEYCKSYGENYCLGQLMYWFTQINADPDCTLAKERRGCLSLPDISSFYAKSNKPLRGHVYDSRTVRFMLSRMEKEPQRPWPKDKIWMFKGSPRIFGSPMLDAVLNKCPVDKEMVQWLKSRPTVFQGSWDG